MLIEVLIELKARAVDKYFTYKVPVNLINKVKVGVRVIVPFAYSKLMGFVTKVNVENTSDYEIKEILDVVDTEVILTDELLELGKYLKEKTLATLISCYQVMLPNGYKASKKKINKKYETYITVNIDKLKDIKLSDKQQDIVNILLKNKQVSYSYLKKN